MSIDFVRQLVTSWLDGRAAQGRLYRITAGTAAAVATGASVTLLKDGDELFTMVSSDGTGGELPAQINIGGHNDATIVEPDADGPTVDRATWRAFQLLDPRILVDLMDRVRVLETGQTIRAVGFVRLDQLRWPLPQGLLDFLQAAADEATGWASWAGWASDDEAQSRPYHPLDHPVAMVFDGETRELLETRQPDLYPRNGDVILVRFAG